MFSAVRKNVEAGDRAYRGLETPASQLSQYRSLTTPLAPHALFQRRPWRAFGGEMVSVLTCKCGEMTFSFEPFQCLSLEIDEDFTDTLDDAFPLFTAGRASSRREHITVFMPHF